MRNETISLQEGQIASEPFVPPTPSIEALLKESRELQTTTTQLMRESRELQTKLMLQLHINKSQRKRIAAHLPIAIIYRSLSTNERMSCAGPSPARNTMV
jgi:hypothetical protein